jgi:Family of unknown function (DUF6527)
MTNVQELRFRGKVSTRDDATKFLKSAGDMVLVERGRPRLLVMSCPCGCGEIFPVNLDSRAGPAWRLYTGRKNGLSLYPSIWRESGCGSHFIIWGNKILLFGQSDDELSTPFYPDYITPLIQPVEQLLPEKGLKPYVEIANQLDAIPWDVLMACRRLVSSRRAWEGNDKQRGSFGRT